MSDTTALRALKALLEERWTAHRDKQSADYNECEVSECAWCHGTREAIAALAPEVNATQVSDTTALRARLEEREAWCRAVADDLLDGQAEWAGVDHYLSTAELFREAREAIAALAPPAEPSTARKDAERLLADCELGPNCNICRVLRALL